MLHDRPHWRPVSTCYSEVVPVAITRYCIGCIHFRLEPRDPGYMGSEDTGRYGESETQVLCAKNHWGAEMGQDATLEEFRGYMEKATDCPDFKERKIP